MHRQRPLATIIPPRHGSRGRCGRGRTSYSGRVGRALCRRDANRQHGRHFCASARDSRGCRRGRGRGHASQRPAAQGTRPRASARFAARAQRAGARSPSSSARLRGGESIALVSDAGTPLVSDPGYLLVAAAIESGIVVTPIPGPSAAIAALSASGLPCDRFCFEGFLPARAAARRRRLAELAAETRTLVVYEAPHRIADCLADLVAACGATRRACVARELTKRFETFYRGSLGELAERANERRRSCARRGRDPHRRRRAGRAGSGGARRNAFGTASPLAAVVRGGGRRKPHGRPQE